jgi:hypothetical protein
VAAPDDETTSQPKRSGRVRHDAGGRAIWEWAVDSGRHAIDSTSRLLKKLDLTSLSLLDDDHHKKLQEAEAKAKEEQAEVAGKTTASPAHARTARELRIKETHAKSGQSFNPYDSHTPTGRGVAAAPRKAPAKPRITQPVRPARKPGFFARLFGRG